MADLLYFQKDWAKCGPAFDSVVDENPSAPEAAEAAYASVLCYQNIYDETHKGDIGKKGAGNLPGQKTTPAQAKAAETEKLKPKDMSDNQKGMVQAFNRQDVSYIKPAANDSKGQDQLVEVKYARARTYFESQHWEEAAIGFRDIALNNADRDVGIYAAQLYLESINVLGSNFSKTSCFDDMEQDVPQFLTLYCAGDKAQKNADQCTTLNKIQVDILRLKAQHLVEDADKVGGKEALAKYEKGGAAYFEMFRKYCQDPVSNGQSPQAEKVRRDRVQRGARVPGGAPHRKGDHGASRAARVRRQDRRATRPGRRRRRTRLAGTTRRSRSTISPPTGTSVTRRPTRRAPEADKALSDAVILRLGLGQEDQAIDDARTFTKNYGGAKPAQTASIAFAVGAHYAEKEDWDKARGALTGSMGVIDKAAPDVQVQAHATLGRVLEGLQGHGREPREGGVREGPWDLERPGRRGDEDPRGVHDRRRRSERASARQGARVSRRGLLLRRGREGKSDVDPLQDARLRRRG